MATRILLRPKVAAAIATATAGLTIIPRKPLFAESPEALEALDIARRKPIYDDSPLPVTAITNPSIKRTTKPSESALGSPTARLATQVAHARMALYNIASQAEDGVNNIVNKAFNLEHDFTSTIASLAPSRQSGEQIMPGGIYVLVAAMGGSILTRNRNFLLRYTVPLAFGIGAGWAVIPVTMANVSALIWRYEEQFPVVADTHIRVREGVKHFVQTGIAHSKMGAAMLEEKIGELREGMEEWVSKGK